MLAASPSLTKQSHKLHSFSAITQQHDRCTVSQCWPTLNWAIGSALLSAWKLLQAYCLLKAMRHLQCASWVALLLCTQS